jgi:hypothetical protein
MKTTSGSITDYCGNFIYADNQLITIFADDVRIAPVNFGNSTYWKYEYSMKNHLGNTRVVFAAHSYGQPELLQQTNYYPFGMTMQQQNFYSQNATENKYLYNSKELHDDQLAGNTCYLPNKGTEFSHLSWPRGVYGDVPGDGEEFMGGGSHTPFLESRKKTKKIVEEKVEQGDFNNFDLFDFYVSSFETPGMSFNVQIHPDIDGEETEEEKKPAGGGGMPGWASDANTGVNAFLVGNGAKTELLDYAIRTNYKSARTASQFNKLRPTQQAWRTTNTLGKTGSQYLKYVKGLGYVGAGLITTYSAVNAGSYYYNGGTDWQVGAKVTLDVIMTGVGFLGPIGFGISAIYFVVDVAGGFGNFGEIKP